MDDIRKDLYGKLIENYEIRINNVLEKIDKMIRFEQVNTKRHSGYIIRDLNEIKKILKDDSSMFK